MYNSFLNKIYLFLESCEQATFYEESQLTAHTALTFEHPVVATLAMRFLILQRGGGRGAFHERRLGGTSASSCVDVAFVH